MGRFNIALLPVDDTLQEVFAGLAQRHFSAMADQYILGPDALAHVTLCQFEASAEEQAHAAFAAWSGKKQLTVSLDGLAMQAGAGEHTGRIWINFPVKKAKELCDLQESCFTHLRKAGLDVFTQPATYFPHVTLARVTALPPSFLLGENIAANPMAMRPTLGRSSEVGVFLADIA